MKTAILIGASGLVGRHLLCHLLNGEHYGRVVALVRRPLDVEHPRLHQVLFDFEHPNTDVIRGDDLFCALGTTRQKAGSKAAQYRVDVEYPFELGRTARANGVQQYLLVSSIGAREDSPFFYLRMKGELERRIAALEFPCFIAVRPSLLLGRRSEQRIGEQIGTFFMEHLFRPFVPLRYRGIPADQVARALVALAGEGRKGVHIVESEQLHRF